jgi:hypothetical protein
VMMVAAGLDPAALMPVAAAQALLSLVSSQNVSRTVALGQAVERQAEPVRNRYNCQMQFLTPGMIF